MHTHTQKKKKTFCRCLHVRILITDIAWMKIDIIFCTVCKFCDITDDNHYRITPAIIQAMNRSWPLCEPRFFPVYFQTYSCIFRNAFTNIIIKLRNCEVLGLQPTQLFPKFIPVCSYYTAMCNVRPRLKLIIALKI